MTNDILDYMASKGRSPSFNSAGNVRGFRSRPGAPMADPTQNKGAITTGTLAGTPQANWDSMFRNRVTGETPSSLAAKRANPPSSVQTAIDAIVSGEPSIAIGSETPSLDTLAAGGPTHQQLWGSNSIHPQFTDVQASGGVQRMKKSKYGWGSSYIPNA